MPKGCVYVASWGKSTAGTILPSTNRIWLKAKYLQKCFCLMRKNKNTWFYVGGSALDLTDDFQKFYQAGLDRIQLNRIRAEKFHIAVRSSLICWENCPTDIKLSWRSSNPINMVEWDGKWLENCQFEWLFCCIWFFCWCTFTRLYVKFFGPLVM